MGIITAILLENLIDSAIDKLRNSLKEHLNRVKINKQYIEESLDYHLKSVESWSNEVKFKDLSSFKTVTNIYVQLDYYLTPSKLIFENNDRVTKLDDILNTTSHSVILGQPGAGKTTSMKFLCQKVLYEENIANQEFNCPIVIKFRDINYNNYKDSNNILINELFNILGISINYFPISSYKDGSKTIVNNNAMIDKAVITFLDTFKPLIILDGFDEITSYNHQIAIIKEVEKLTLGLKFAKVILTSRTGEFHYSLPATSEYEICPLNENQIKEFTIKWLNDEKTALELFNQLKSSPFYDTTMRPLTLAHLCAIFEREKKIPEKPKTVYRKVINLLLEEWNLQRNVRRESHFSNFEIDRKYEFLSYLAYQLTVDCPSTVFSKYDLNRIYIEICDNFSLPKDEVKKVIQELESHNGLFIQSGYDRFQFPHKSIQEFLTSEFLVKSFALPNNHTLLNIPNELALAISICSVPSDYLSALILNNLGTEIKNHNFIEPFINRILIEKPDFQPCLALGVTFAFIYHCCLYNGKDNFNDYNYTFQNLKNLLNSLFTEFKPIQKSIYFLNEFYIKQGTNIITGDDMMLVRNKKPFSDKVYSINYPKIIIIRAIYLQ